MYFDWNDNNTIDSIHQINIREAPAPPVPPSYTMHAVGSRRVCGKQSLKTQHVETQCNLLGTGRGGGSVSNSLISPTWTHSISGWGSKDTTMYQVWCCVVVFSREILTGNKESHDDWKERTTFPRTPMPGDPSKYPSMKCPPSSSTYTVMLGAPMFHSGQ